MLIFLIFVMLAAERRSELGIARAVGTRRGHLVQCSLRGRGLRCRRRARRRAARRTRRARDGVGDGDGAVGDAGLQIAFAVAPRSLVVAYAIGVVLTLVVVAVSAWRVSA